MCYWFQGKATSGSVTVLSPGSSSNFSQSPSSYTKNPGSNSIINDFFDPYQSLSSPEVSSEIAIKNNGMDHLDRVDRREQRESSPEIEVTQALRRLEEQLSLNEDSVKCISTFYSQDENSNDSDILQYEMENAKQDQCAALLPGPEDIDQFYGGHVVIQDSNNLEFLSAAGSFFPCHPVYRIVIMNLYVS